MAPMHATLAVGLLLLVVPTGTGAARLPALGNWASGAARRWLLATPLKVTTLEPAKLKVCLYAGFPPAAIKNADGTWGGEEVKHLATFAKSHGLKLTPVEVPTFAGIWLQPGLGKCDISAGGISITPQRTAAIARGAAFTKRYRGDARALVVAKGKTVSGPKDLAGKVVLVTKGSTGESDLKARLAAANVTTAIIRYSDSEDKAAATVASGTTLKGDKQPVFAYATSADSAQGLAKKMPGKVASTYVHCLTQPDGTEMAEELGYVVRTPPLGGGKADTTLLDALNVYIKGTPGGPQGKWPVSFLDCSAAAKAKTANA